MSQRRAGIDLFLVSALGLFVELIFIRWVGSELRIFGFYKNLALIAAFLGLGVGFAIYRKLQSTDWFTRYYLPLMATTTFIVLGLGRNETINNFILTHSNPQEFLWAQTLQTETGQSLFFLDILFYVTMLVLFGLLTIVFIPLGQITASKFTAFKSLPAYTINVAGSLTGILAYTLISFLSWPPYLWFLITGIVTLYFLPRSPRNLAINGALAAAPVLLTLLWPIKADQTVWSPYYRIDITREYAEDDPSVLLDYDVSVNQSYHQKIYNLSPEFVEAHHDLAPDFFDAALAEYDTPYRVAADLDEVLIVGAGTGNDVAAALRADAGTIIAVEIDPVIFRLGRELHPEHPYDDPVRVRQLSQDARSFFRRDTNHYDLIVFGLLDSHTLFSSASSVRLDNFVYTRESLTEVRRLLAEDGVLALSFAVPDDRQWVGLRLYRTLTDAFGYSPVVYEFPNDVTMFLISENEDYEFIVDEPLAVNNTSYSYQSEIDPTTDDWPFLYLQQRTIPTTYIIILAGVLLLSIPLVRSALPNFRSLNLHFFFMGTAFFLLETKSITEMALLFGSTWIVNAVVISTILTMIILANLVVQRLNLTKPALAYGFLVAALLFNYFVPVSSFLGLSGVLRILLAGIAQAAPLFFAAIIFAITFNHTDSADIAIGSNLLGAVLGGVLEYSSLMFGIRSLYLLALAFYALSALTWFMPMMRTPAPTTESGSA